MANGSTVRRCIDRGAVHVHGFCAVCNGKPVNYRTQISHMKLNAFCDLQPSVAPSTQEVVESVFDNESD